MARDETAGRNLHKLAADLQRLTESCLSFHDQSVLAGADGQILGLKEVEENTRLVTFMDHYLGYTDLDEKCLQSLKTHFEHPRCNLCWLVPISWPA